MSLHWSREWLGSPRSFVLRVMGNSLKSEMRALCKPWKEASGDVKTD